MEVPKLDKIQETAASEVRSIVFRVEEMAEAISKTLADKTAQFCLPDYPPPQPETATARELPPYFSDLRSTLWRIETQLYNIANTISRMDI